MSAAAKTLWPQDGVIFRHAGHDVRVEEGAHPVYFSHKSAIEENWEREHAANPALFNGQMLLHSDVRIDDAGRVASRAFLSPYSTMLWWRKQPDRPLAQHLFSVAIPITSDGAILAVQMGGHTANPGRIYCAAGSLDGHDIFEGKADLDRNMLREVTEETGLDLADATDVSGYFGICIQRATTVFRFFRLPYDAQETVDRVRAHMTVDPEQEIAGPVIIRDNRMEGRDYAAFMRPLIESVFGDENQLADIWKQG